MGYSIIDNKVAYWETPKCASRTVMGYGYLLRYPESYINSSEMFLSNNYTYAKIRKESKKWMKNTDDYPIRFCVVRDPVDRFISAFSNRILFRRMIPSGMKINIHSFIETFDNPEYYEAYTDIKHHLLSQVYYLGNNPDFYTHIFNMSQINSLKSLIEENSGVRLPELTLNVSDKSSKPWISPSEIQWIKDKFKKDYEIYGKWM